MVKNFIYIIGFLSLAVAFNAYAHDSERIDQLEKEIRGIELRLSELESLLTKTGKDQELVTSGEGWKSINSWRRLTTNMSTSDVQKILGVPHRVDGGIFAQWYYQNGGTVRFYEGKVREWREPQ